MRALAGKVVNGQIVVAEPISNGTEVTVLVEEQGDAVELSPEDERELVRRIKEMERGEYVEYNSVEELIADLCS